MKKVLMFSFSAILAVAAVAFTTVDNPNKFATYYFHVNASGNPIPESTLLTTNPSECLGGTVLCAKAYTSYSIVSGKYVSSGNFINDTFKP